MRRFLFENGLSVFFGVLCLGTLAGQALAGQRAFNAEQRAHGAETVSWVESALVPPRNAPRWAKAGGWRTLAYQNSLLVVMTLIFAGTWFAQSVTAWRVFNEEQQEHDESTVSWGT